MGTEFINIDSSLPKAVTGSGADVRANSPTLTTPTINTPTFAAGLSLPAGTSGTNVTLQTPVLVNPTFASTFRVLQVVQGTYATAVADTSTPVGASCAIDTVTATITPGSSSSRIHVRAVLNVCPALAGQNHAFLVRNSTVIGQGTSAGTRPGVGCSIEPPLNADQMPTPATLEYIDSPNSSSAFTYRAKVMAAFAAGIYINRSINDTDTANYPRGLCVMTLTEYSQ